MNRIIVKQRRMKSQEILYIKSNKKFYVYIYIYIYIYIYTHTHIQFIHIYIYTCTHIIYKHMYIHSHIYTDIIYTYTSHMHAFIHI